MVERISKTAVTVETSHGRRTIIGPLCLVIFETRGKEFVRGISNGEYMDEEGLVNILREKYGFEDCNLIQIISL